MGLEVGLLFFGLLLAFIWRSRALWLGAVGLGVLAAVGLLGLNFPAWNEPDGLASGRARADSRRGCDPDEPSCATDMPTGARTRGRRCGPSSATGRRRCISPSAASIRRSWGIWRGAQHCQTALTMRRWMRWRLLAGWEWRPI